MSNMPYYLTNDQPLILPSSDTYIIPVKVIQSRVSSEQNNVKMFY